MEDWPPSSGKKSKSRLIIHGGAGEITAAKSASKILGSVQSETC